MSMCTSASYSDAATAAATPVYTQMNTQALVRGVPSLLVTPFAAKDCDRS